MRLKRFQQNQHQQISFQRLWTILECVVQLGAKIGQIGPIGPIQNRFAMTGTIMTILLVDCESFW